MFKNMGGNFPGGNFLGGNFPGGSFPDTYISVPLMLIVHDLKSKPTVSFA